VDRPGEEESRKKGTVRRERDRERRKVECMKKTKSHFNARGKPKKRAKGMRKRQLIKAAMQEEKKKKPNSKRPEESKKTTDRSEASEKGMAVT